MIWLALVPVWLVFVVVTVACVGVIFDKDWKWLQK